MVEILGNLDILKSALARRFDVLTINEADLSGMPDSVVLERARQEERLLLTQNCRDFESLHLANPNHSGILAVYQDSDRSKNMSFEDVVKAISNLEANGIPLAKVKRSPTSDLKGSVG